MAAIRNNHYVGWPLLTVNNVHNHYPETVETPRGHLNQQAAGIHSTNPGPEPLPQADQADVKKAFNVKERDVFIRVWEPKDAIYSDQTGKFPVQSRRKKQLHLHHGNVSRRLERCPRRTNEKQVRERNDPGLHCAVILTPPSRLHPKEAHPRQRVLRGVQDRHQRNLSHAIGPAGFASGKSC